MDLILKNPFRILGLPVAATDREISKRVSDLEIFAELGKAKTYPFDFPVLGEVDRSPDAIKDAARRLESPLLRLAHSIFWFRQGDQVDEQALKHLGNFELRETDRVFSESIEASEDLGQVTWRINRGIFSLWMCYDHNESRLDDQARVYFEQALEDIGYVTDELYDDAFKLIPSNQKIDPKQVREFVADAIVQIANTSEENSYGPNALHIVDQCWSFHHETLDYIKSLVTNPLINRIQDAIIISQNIRSQGATIDDLRRKNGLSKVESLIYELQTSLGKDNHRFQAIANAFANEVITCAINALNEHGATSTALVLAEWAAELPSFGERNQWINKQRGTIIKWDPSYSPDPDPEEDFSDVEEKADEVNDDSPPRKVPTETTICPRCKKHFEPDEVMEYLDFGVRCPHCSQPIVLL
jgi:hypothetical protein